jgi:hypothetical protein
MYLALWLFILCSGFVSFRIAPHEKNPVRYLNKAQKRLVRQIPGLGAEAGVAYDCQRITGLCAIYRCERIVFKGVS